MIHLKKNKTSTQIHSEQVLNPLHGDSDSSVKWCFWKSLNLQVRTSVKHDYIRSCTHQKISHNVILALCVWCVSLFVGCLYKMTIIHSPNSYFFYPQSFEVKLKRWRENKHFCILNTQLWVSLTQLAFR